MENIEQVLCRKCGKIIWRDAVPAGDGEGGKSDDEFFHLECAQEVEAAALANLE